MSQPLIDALPLLIEGTGETLLLFTGSAILSGGAGALLGIMASKRICLARRPILAYIALMRGVPLFILALITYFALPQLCGLTFTPFWAGTLALGMCSAGYVAEITRGTIDNLPKGQWEACSVLGLNKIQSLRLVIIPQAVRLALPALANEYSSLLKSTAILAAIGAQELTRAAMGVVARELDPTIYLVAAGLYLACNSAIGTLFRIAERKMSNA